MSKYQNQDVTVVRDAKEGDAGFDADKGAQVVIRMPDGSEKTVLKSEVKG